MLKSVFAVFMFGVILLAAQPAWCDEESTEEQVYAIQNRVFDRSHELNLSLGNVLDDDFFHVYPIGLSYTYHFNQRYAWEVGRFLYHFNEAKELKSTLENEFNVTPERFPEQKFSYFSHFVYKPLYGKHAFLNRAIINSEFNFFAGLGMIHYEWERSFGASETEDAMAVSFGVGWKYFINDKFCLNVELREIVSFRQDDTEYYPAYSFGLGYRFNLAPRKVQEDPSMKKLKRILDEE